MRTKFLNGLFVIMLAFMCVGCGTKNTTTEIEESKLEQEVEVLEETEESISVQESETAEVIEEPTIETEINEEVAVETEAAIEETTETTTETEEPVQEPEPQAVYTYTDMSATMYATQTVNVRNLPSTDGEKVGSLSTNQEITVIGQCNETSWYMFDYNGQTAFVSNNYVSTEKVEVASPAQGTVASNACPYTLWEVTDNGSSMTWYVTQPDPNWTSAGHKDTQAWMMNTIQSRATNGWYDQTEWTFIGNYAEGAVYRQTFSILDYCPW